MEKKATFGNFAKNNIKKLSVSLMLVTAIVFGTTGQAQARISDMEAFMTQEAKDISVMAHPTAEYAGSTYEGNGVLSIYYRGFSDGLLTLRVQGTMDSDGHFSDLYVLSDEGFVPPFTVLTLVRKGLGAYLNSVEYKAENAGAELAWDYLKRAINGGNGQTMCEAYLVLDSYIYRF